ncbi:lactadherin-like [Diadema antillarum]|uniref:lactadherin-like n=1 Tax=Diadema antillarum TaxID=105358 RepID=UPI003A87A1FD
MLELIGCEFSECSSPLHPVGAANDILNISCKGCTRGTESRWRLHVYNVNGSSGVQFLRGSSDGVGIKWLQVDFASLQIITGIINQGGTSNGSLLFEEDGDFDEFVIEYQAEESETWRTYLSDSGKQKIFNGLKDPFSLTINNLPRPILATKLRIVFQRGIDDSGGIRFQLLGCRLGAPETMCVSNEVFYAGYCLGVINNDTQGACDKIFRPGSYAVAVKTRKVQEFLDSHQNTLAASASNLVIGLTVTANNLR